MKLLSIFFVFTTIFSGCYDGEKSTRFTSSDIIINESKHFIISAKEGPKLIFHNSQKVNLIHLDSGEWLMEFGRKRKEIERTDIYLIDANGNARFISPDEFPPLGRKEKGVGL